MFGDMRLAQPPHRRCEADGAFEPLNRRDAGGLCLPIAKTDLFDHIQALDGFIALEYELNERMFFGLWPGCWVHRQHQKLALGDEPLLAAPRVASKLARTLHCRTIQRA